MGTPNWGNLMRRWTVKDINTPWTEEEYKQVVESGFNKNVIDRLRGWKADERTELKAILDENGVKYHWNLATDKLRDLVNNL